MKNIFYAVLIFSLFNSCKSNTKQETKDTTNIKSASDQTENLIQKFKPIIQGVWVKKDYIEKVIENKSPLAAMDKAVGMTTMYINMEHIKGDSVIVPVGWGNHEGGDITLKFQSGKTPSTIVFGGGELGYNIENGDTTLIISRFDEEKKTTVKTKYSKALNKQPPDDLGYGMSYLINKGLISDKYVLIDSTGAQNNVTFTKDGKVIGISGFKTYYIDNDLGGEPMSNLDEIIFNIYTKNQINYSFTIKKDTLNIYETHANTDSTELVLDKLKYKLIRQK